MSFIIYYTNSLDIHHFSLLISNYTSAWLFLTCIYFYNVLKRMFLKFIFYMLMKIYLCLMRCILRYLYVYVCICIVYTFHRSLMIWLVIKGIWPALNVPDHKWRQLTVSFFIGVGKGTQCTTKITDFINLLSYPLFS